MNLNEAIEKFENMASLVEDKSLPKDNAIEICSGGFRKKDHERSFPALFVDQSDAIWHWYISATDEAIERVADTYRFVEPPTLEKYQITMQDARGSHRVVADRYVVTSKIVFGATKDE